ncbi:MAG: class I SAM-dependent methyltransferase [Candidatus Endonucleobacter bathymodioli]|uniref:Class I SAM-dependent methyltransferase n=1 Tax=Candidatus Endonucleibacter bathymodioli TaxID=539814 RepID=A0AA90NLP4_9GAMM|nr:class I SAM-dependent methyltransferase [Candidatus Endonucleobacter bathymodioli]
MTITCSNWDRESWISSVEYIAHSVKVLSECLEITPNSKILDIGCGRAGITTALAEANNVETPVEGIDISDTISEAPNCNKVNLFQIDALSYLKGQPDNLYHGIILKQMLHCVSTDIRKQLLQEIHRCLKKSARALVFLMPPKITIPMFTQGKDTFLQEQLHFQDIINLGQDCLFETDISEFCFNVEISKQQYFDLLRQRFMSNLRNLSDSEIENGILELDLNYPTEVLKFTDLLHIIHLIKVAPA